MISSIIVDDEPRNIDVLNRLITDYCEGISIVATASSVDAASRVIREKKPDLVFLDIEMPGKNAFDLIEELYPVDFEIIFVTAFEHYAIKAFRYSALDYLLKPVNLKELREAIQRAGSRIKEKNIQARLDNLLSFENKKEMRIAVQLKNGYQFHSSNDIICCSAEGSYTRIYLANGSSLLSSSNLKHFDDLLPDDIFCRIHHAHLVNLNFAVSYSKGRSGMLQLTNGISLEVSQRKKDELLSRFQK